MLLCNCQGSLCIGLKAEQRTLAIVWGRQHTLAAGRRFKLIVRGWPSDTVKCSRKKIFIRGAFGFIFLRRSLAFDLTLFCFSFFDHVIASSFFETIPSRPSLQTALNISLPSPSVCSTNSIPPLLRFSIFPSAPTDSRHASVHAPNQVPLEAAWRRLADMNG